MIIFTVINSSSNEKEFISEIAKAVGVGWHISWDSEDNALTVRLAKTKEALRGNDVPIILQFTQWTSLPVFMLTGENIGLELLTGVLLCRVSAQMGYLPVASAVQLALASKYGGAIASDADNHKVTSVNGRVDMLSEGITKTDIFVQVVPEVSNYEIKKQMSKLAEWILCHAWKDLAKRFMPGAIQNMHFWVDAQKWQGEIYTEDVAKGETPQVPVEKVSWSDVFRKYGHLIQITDLQDYRMAVAVWQHQQSANRTTAFE